MSEHPPQQPQEKKKKKKATVDQLYLKDVLDELAVADPITIHQDKSLTEALQVLGKKGILSAPVVDDNNRCVGLIDVLDCVAFAVNIYYSNTTQESGPSQFKNTVMQFAFQVQTVHDAMDLSNRNPFHPTKVESTKVMDILEKLATGVHRVPIVDDKGCVTHVITQSNMFAFLFPQGEDDQKVNANQYGDILPDSTVDELKLGFRETDDRMLYTVLETTAAMDAFKQIFDKGVSAVGVMNKMGKKLIGNVSASDLIGFLGEEDVNYLGESVTIFQQHVSQKRKRHGLQDAAFCKRNSYVVEVVRRLQVSGRIHRIYVMDDNMKPIGIISYTDLFRLIHEQLCKQNSA